MIILTNLHTVYFKLRFIGTISFITSVSFLKSFSSPSLRSTVFELLLLLSFESSSFTLKIWFSYSKQYRMQRRYLLNYKVLSMTVSVLHHFSANNLLAPFCSVIGQWIPKFPIRLQTKVFSYTINTNYQFSKGLTFGKFAAA